MEFYRKPPLTSVQVLLQEQELRRLMTELQARDRELSQMASNHQEQLKAWVCGPLIGHR